jgi:hypothetical protein
VYKRDLEANVKRIWPVLLTVDSVAKSPLLGLTERSLWITGSNHTFRSHMRFVAYRKPPTWGAFVATDSKIITSWLSTAKDVFDADVAGERVMRPSDEFMTIEDIAVPPALLIILLGVKAAKNREMPNVLLEAIQERDVRGKPTWVVDSPLQPLQEGHICYNPAVIEVLSGFQRVMLDQGTPAVQQVSIASPTRSIPGATSSPYTKMKPGMALTGPPAPEIITPKPTPKPHVPRHTPPSLPGRVDDDIALDRSYQPPKLPTPPPRALETIDPDDLSLEALAILSEHTAQLLVTPPGAQYRPDEDYDDGVLEEGGEPDYLEEARLAAAKPIPAGRRTFRPGDI